MAFTKVVGPGIHTQSQLRTHNIHSSGIITASSFVGPLTASSGSSGTFDSLTVTGNVSVGGTLQYEDVINVESVGIITSKEGIFLPDSKELKLGNTAASPDLKIYHNPSTTPDTNTIVSASGQILELQTDKLRIVDVGATKDLIAADDGGSVDLFCAGNKKLETTSTGAVVTGILTATNGLKGTTGTFSSDVSIADKIVHTGDTDTSIRFPAADQISFETGATGSAVEYLKLHRYASVNFAEVGSAAHISLADNGTNIRAILIGDGNASSTGGLRLQAGGGSSGFGGGIVMYSHANADNPGGVYIGKSVAATGSIIFGNSGTGNVTSNNEFARILSTGVVAIGRTTAPNDINKLVVTGTSPADEYDSTLYLEGSEETGAINTGGALAFGGHDGSAARNWANIYGMKENANGGNTASYMSFHTRPAGGGPTERFRIDSSGHIHTGYTTNITGADHVNILASDGGGVSVAQNNDGNAAAGTTIGSYSFQGYHQGGATFTSAEARISAIAAANHTGGSAATDMVFYTKPSTTGPGSAPTETLRIDSNGWQSGHTAYKAVGINTFASWARTGGAIRAEVGYNAVTLDYMYFGTGTTHPLALRTNNNNALFIDNNQKIGIGTENPQNALDVRNASGTDPTLFIGHSNADVIGEAIRIGRVAPYNTIRYHSIKAEHSGGAASNMISFHLHKGGTPATDQVEVLKLQGDEEVKATGRLHMARKGVSPDTYTTCKETFYEEVANGASHDFQTASTYGGGLVYITSCRDGNATYSRTQVYLIAMRATANSGVTAAVFNNGGGASGDSSFTVAGCSKGVTVTNNSGHTSDIFVTFDIHGFVG